MAICTCPGAIVHMIGPIPPRCAVHERSAEDSIKALLEVLLAERPPGWERLRQEVLDMDPRDVARIRHRAVEEVDLLSRLK